MERIAVFGATSGIARAVCHRFMQDGEELVLLGRSILDLEELSKDLEKKYRRPVPFMQWDVLEFELHQTKFSDLQAMGSLKGVLFAVGVLIDQGECDTVLENTKRTIDTNLTGPMTILGLFVNHFLTIKKSNCFISCISSVAGERGRGEIVAYAASKAGLTTYMAGLRHRLVGKGILVQTIKPGFVKTRMLGKVNSILTVSPEWAANDIVKAIRLRREVLYTPFFWRYIMFIIRSIPEIIFKRLKF